MRLVLETEPACNGTKQLRYVGCLSYDTGARTEQMDVWKLVNDLLRLIVVSLYQPIPV